MTWLRPPRPAPSPRPSRPPPPARCRLPAPALLLSSDSPGVPLLRRRGAHSSKPLQFQSFRLCPPPNVPSADRPTPLFRDAGTDSCALPVAQTTLALGSRLAPKPHVYSLSKSCASTFQTCPGSGPLVGPSANRRRGPGLRPSSPRVGVIGAACSGFPPRSARQTTASQMLLEPADHPRPHPRAFAPGLRSAGPTAPSAVRLAHSGFS